MAENRVDLCIVDKLLPLLTTPKRVKVIVGGRGSAKSTGVGDIMLMFAGQGRRILCTREFQNSIDDSVHMQLKDSIQRLGVEGYETAANKITTSTDGQISYRGLARNITSIKSIAGIDYLWVEEAESVSETSLRVLTPSIRSSAGDDRQPELWFTMNRRSSQDAVAKKYLKRADSELRRCGFYEDDLMMAVEINWRDNPWFPPELEQERQDDYKNLTTAVYRHIWEGEYNDEIENSIISVDWFEAAIDSHKKLGFKPSGAIIAAHDPSDEGADSKGLAVRHGSVVLNVSENLTGDSNEGCDWAINEAIRYNSDHFVWDGDGMGIALKRQVDESLSGKRIDRFIFRGSESPEDPSQIYLENESIDHTKAKTNQETFFNRRAQYYWKLRDRFYATYRAVVKGEYIDPDKLISLPSDLENLDKLRAEVCRIPLKRNNNGKIQIMSKLDMSKKPYELPSPNMADALMMCMYAPAPAVAAKKINFSGWG